MQMRNKMLATIIAVLLISSMAASLVVVQPANAGWSPETTAAKNAGMKWDFPNAENYNSSATRLLLWNRWHDQIPTWTYAVLSPNPVGVGQGIAIVMFLEQQPLEAQLSSSFQC